MSSTEFNSFSSNPIPTLQSAFFWNSKYINSKFYALKFGNPNKKLWKKRLVINKVLNLKELKMKDAKLTMPSSPRKK